MKHIRRVSPTALLATLAVAGLAVALTGLYGIAGRDATLLVGGACVVAVALLVDV